MLPTKRVSGKVVALALAVFAASWCFSFAASEYEYAVLDDVPSAAPRSVQTVTPPHLLSSTTDQNTGLRVDTYVNPLLSLIPILLLLPSFAPSPPSQPPPHAVHNTQPY